MKNLSDLTSWEIFDLLPCNDNTYRERTGYLVTHIGMASREANLIALYEYVMDTGNTNIQTWDGTKINLDFPGML